MQSLGAERRSASAQTTKTITGSSLPPQLPGPEELVAVGAPLAGVHPMVNPKCRRCGKTGLVRTERVISGQRAKTVFYCGGCGYSWEEQDHVERPSHRRPGHDK